MVIPRGMARACKIARPRNLYYCEFELRHSMGETPVERLVRAASCNRKRINAAGFQAIWAEDWCEHNARRETERSVGKSERSVCIFWDRPKPLPALWRMPKASDRLSADCINPCLNIFLRSTEHGFIELHIEAPASRLRLCRLPQSPSARVPASRHWWQTDTRSSRSGQPAPGNCAWRAQRCTTRQENPG